MSRFIFICSRIEGRIFSADEGVPNFDGIAGKPGSMILLWKFFRFAGTVPPPHAVTSARDNGSVNNRFFMTSPKGEVGEISLKLSIYLVSAAFKNGGQDLGFPELLKVKGPPVEVLHTRGNDFPIKSAIYSAE